MKDKLRLSTKKARVRTKKSYTKNMKQNPIFDPKYEGKWIALSPDHKKVLGSSEKLDLLRKRVKNRNAVFTMGLSSSISYTF
jgi:hypothetical protein